MHLDQRIGAWLADAEGRLVGMEEEEIAAYKASAIASKLQADRSVFDEAERFWEQIASGRYCTAFSLHPPKELYS